MKPKKILLFSLSLKKGGAENQLSKLAIFLQNTTEFDVSVAYFVKGNDFEEVFQKNDITYTYFNVKQVSQFFSLLKYCRNLKPHLIISFMFGANLIARFIKTLSGIPIITSVRNNEISGWYKNLYKLTYKIDNATTFNSQYALEKFIKEKLTKKQSSYLVNNAITVKENEYVTKNNQVFTLISLAHFRPQKDYKTLFQAIKLLKNDNVSVKLFVLGHLYKQEWPFELIKELGIEEEVEIVGFTLDTESYLNKADTLVLSSLWEGTPNAILEGMAHYLPIIASDIPGSNELVINSKAGVLFETQNADDLKDKIIYIMSLSTEDKKNLGINGNKYIVENYKDSNVYQKWLEIIKLVQ